MFIPTNATSGVIGYSSIEIRDFSGNVINVVPGRLGYSTPMSVRINTRGPFLRRIPASNSMNDRLGEFGRFAAGRLRSRVTQLLHEIGHLVFRNRSVFPLHSSPNTTNEHVAWDRVLRLDGSDADLSDVNTDLVLEACRDQINQLRQ